MAGVNPFATDPTAVRRVSYFSEWRPPTLAPEDKIYRSYDGIVNGQRFINDDNDLDPLTGDQRIDEDFLDGRDNDGDGLIDEDYGAIGQQMFSFDMRDDTPQAINAAFGAEAHVPLGLEVSPEIVGLLDPRLPGFQRAPVRHLTTVRPRIGLPLHWSAV